jgi:hypothetical protein
MIGTEPARSVLSLRVPLRRCALGQTGYGFFGALSAALTPASVQIRSTRSAGYPVNSTISSFVRPDIGRACDRAGQPVPGLDELVLRPMISLEGQG